MAIQRGAFSALLTPDLRTVYFETGKERPLEYPMVFNVDDMEWNPMTDRQISGLGTMPQKPEGAQFTPDVPILGGTKAYTAVPFGLAVEITCAECATCTSDQKLISPHMNAGRVSNR